MGDRSTAKAALPRCAVQRQLMSDATAGRHERKSADAGGARAEATLLAPASAGDRLAQHSGEMQVLA